MDWNGVIEHCEKEASAVLGKGKVADYIPALAKADPNDFAMAVIDLEGDNASTGAVDTAFSIQSVSKIFSLSLALAERREKLWRRVGREPSGSGFNSIVQLEREEGIPRNPLINAGAIVVTDAIMTDKALEDASSAVLDHLQQTSVSKAPCINEEVAASEQEWGDRNRALAYFMKSFDRLENNPADVLTSYFRQCSIDMTVVELARAGLHLANGGKDPLTGKRYLTRAQSNRINALMMMCGHYDMSGDFAFRVGLPAKSGVGGAILAIAPGAGAVAVWSPGLNKAGNSLAGTVALEAFTDCTGLNVFSDKMPESSKFED